MGFFFGAASRAPPSLPSACSSIYLPIYLQIPILSTHLYQLTPIQTSSTDLYQTYLCQTYIYELINLCQIYLYQTCLCQPYLRALCGRLALGACLDAAAPSSLCVAGAALGNFQLCCIKLTSCKLASIKLSPSKLPSSNLSLSDLLLSNLLSLSLSNLPLSDLAVPSLSLSNLWLSNFLRQTYFHTTYLYQTYFYQPFLLSLSKTYL